jgi:type I restriction-modification system DNA methylase subunit
MGYAESSCLKYGRDGFMETTLSTHCKKVLEDIAPYAVYFVDNAPFVLFYEETTNKESQKLINRKIWNAQIPLTIVCSTGDVKVYSSCSINRKKAAFNEVISLPSGEINENSPFSYWEITSQSFWAEYAKQFTGKRLNDHLLRNLSDITKKLREDYKVDFATKLILRLIFIRYLIDRGVDLDYTGFKSGVDESRKSFLKILSDKIELYKLFSHLKIKFNGNLFELDNETETPYLTCEVLQALVDFFSANIDTETGQYSYFDLYDFNLIPVELISNIYEILLGKEARNRENAFYTPKYLVDYILDGSISLYIRDNGVCKVLDPSCGSGIFLVESYRRMVEKELRGSKFAENDELLRDILSENIYGVDLNKDAVDVAIFSLYLAILDYKNPKTLVTFELPNLNGKNLFVADFFDDEALSTLKEIQFSFIIGNPPWGSQKGLHTEYCKNKGYSHLIQNNDTCRSFILRSKDFRSVNTQCCLVLHSKMLYMQKEQSKLFRKFLLTETKIIRIVELSSVRKLVFKDADAPAIILTYSFTDNISLENRIEYISMKPNLFFRLFNIIAIEKTDIKYVQQKLLENIDWAWKTLVYGLSGDIDTVLYLMRTYETINTVIARQRPELLLGAGVEYQDGDLNDASHLLERPFLFSDAIKHFSLNTNKVTKFLKSRVHRPRDERIFHAPYCLLLTGIDTNSYTMRSTYSDEDFVFRKAVYAFKGHDGQESFLKNLTGLFNSDLYAYLNLLMGSSLGIEREQRLIDEVLKFPFVFNDDIIRQVDIIQKMSKHENFTVAEDVSVEIEKLNKMIFEAFNLADNSFVDYALNIQIPQLTNSVNCKAFQPVGNQQLCDYAKPFLEALSVVFAMSDKFVTATIYPNVAKYYSAVEVSLCNGKPMNDIKVIDDYDSLQTALTRFSTYKINDMFYNVKDIVHFEEDSFYIIKANFYKNWHPAIAQLDLAEVIDQILSRNEGDH